MCTGDAAVQLDADGEDDDVLVNGTSTSGFELQDLLILA